MTIFEKVDAYKAKIDNLRPFEGDMLSQIKAYYRIGLTYTSNALEGNTLTESETKVLLEDGLTVGGKPLRDTFEAVGHAKAYDFMFTLLKASQITIQDILTMHRLFYQDIDEKNAGKYREQQVIVSGSKYPVTRPADIVQEIAALMQWMADNRTKHHPIAFSAQVHKKFVFIHPFIDGNGRLARLIMNALLIQEGYMLAIIPPVLRQDYIVLLEKAHTDDQGFIAFIAERVYETEKEMLRLLG